MKIVYAFLGVIALLAAGAVSPLTPVSGELPHEQQFVQAKGKGKAGKAGKAANKKMLRKHLASAKAAEHKLRVALRDANKVRGPYGGLRDQSLGSMRKAHQDLRELVAHIKRALK